MIIGNAIYLGGTPLPTLTNPAVASDIRYGKQAVDGDGELLIGTIEDYEGETDTGTVIPVDTGANGLYKAMIGRNVTEIVDEGLTSMRINSQRDNTDLVKVSLPSALTLGNQCFAGCLNITGIVDLPSLLSMGSTTFQRAFRRTVKYIINPDATRSCFSYLFNLTNAVHAWCPNGKDAAASLYMTDNSQLQSLQFDNLEKIDIFRNMEGQYLNTLIIRTPTLCACPYRLMAGNFQVDGTGRIYVPSALLNDYKSATNWITIASLFIGIDEDTTATVGTPFTPTTSATVDHWDQVDLQSYSVGTIDTTTGSITPTHDGRLLIRGLDSSDNIVHVTYLQIGTGFDEEANLAD